MVLMKAVSGAQKQIKTSNRSSHHHHHMINLYLPKQLLSQNTSQKIRFYQHQPKMESNLPQNKLHQNQIHLDYQMIVLKRLIILINH